MFEQLPLKDIHTPEPVSWWPPAVGWWLLPVAVVLIAVAAWMLARAGRRFLARRRLRRQALGELARIRRDFAEGGDAARPMERLSVLLRRVAVTVFEEPGIAGTSGRARIDWLVRTGPTALDGRALAPLAEAPYRPAPPAAPAAVFEAAARWIRHVTRRAA